LAGVYTCFLAVYVALIFTRDTRVRRLMLLAMALLGAAYYPMNPSAGATVFIYVASLTPYATGSFSLAVGTIIASTLASAAEGFLLHRNAWEWGSLSFLAACIGTGNLIQALRSGATERLLRAQEEIEHLAKVAERERIARDLHDVLGHTLSLIIVKSTLAGKLIDKQPEKAKHEIADIEKASRDAMAEIRSTLRGYSSYKINEEIQRAKSTLSSAGILAKSDTVDISLSPAQESVVALIMREAVTNVVRHSHARNCRLRLARENGACVLSVEDDGRGGLQEEGNGLRG